ncbi:hypothetical protein F441_22501 [Phytophthora nicotianae CJ01A1]|uniref:Uncharacterized protein n=1 Tax=Phytophthora nicotianae CJ01A1 TaxID=1317063 RepID=W2VNZ7_PHYNI|nr:hypothetical protein F441_22501 [Phytophthora nicotianae CJ01A1]
MRQVVTTMQDDQGYVTTERSSGPTTTKMSLKSNDDYKPHSNDFLVIGVPETTNLLLGMPWLKAVKYQYKKKKVYKSVFKQQLSSCLPPRERGEHVMDVVTKEAIFRRQWSQSPGQENVIMDWVREMRSAGLLRPPTSPHGAPTLCVKKKLSAGE